MSFLKIALFFSIIILEMDEVFENDKDPKPIKEKKNFNI